jgi:hypothetical protein
VQPSIFTKELKFQSKFNSEERRQGQSKAGGSERLKAVVRRLAPNLFELSF